MCSGAIAPSDRTIVERQLASCPRCVRRRRLRTSSLSSVTGIRTRSTISRSGSWPPALGLSVHESSPRSRPGISRAGRQAGLAISIGDSRAGLATAQRAGEPHLSPPQLTEDGHALEAAFDAGPQPAVLLGQRLQRPPHHLDRRRVLGEVARPQLDRQDPSPLRPGRQPTRPSLTAPTGSGPATTRARPSPTA